MLARHLDLDLPDRVRRQSLVALLNYRFQIGSTTAQVIKLSENYRQKWVEDLNYFSSSLLGKPDFSKLQSILAVNVTPNH